MSALVRDLAGARYRSALGMPLEFQAPTGAFLACEGVTLMLAVPERPQSDDPSSISFCRDVEQTFPALMGEVPRDPAR